MQSLVFFSVICFGIITLSMAYTSIRLRTVPVVAAIFSLDFFGAIALIMYLHELFGVDIVLVLTVWNAVIFLMLMVFTCSAWAVFASALSVGVYMINAMFYIDITHDVQQMINTWVYKPIEIIQTLIVLWWCIDAKLGSHYYFKRYHPSDYYRVRFTGLRTQSGAILS